MIVDMGLVAVDTKRDIVVSVDVRQPQKHPAVAGKVR